MPQGNLGRTVVFQASAQTCHVNSATATEKFYLTGSPAVEFRGVETYLDDAESGKTTHLSTAAPVVTRHLWQKSMEMYADNHNLTFFSYFAGAKAAQGTRTADQGGVGSNVALHTFEGPVAAFSDAVYCFTAEDQASTATEISNHKIEDVVVESCELTLSPSAEASLSLNLRGGQTTSGGATTSLTTKRSAVFSPRKAYLFTSATLGTTSGNYNTLTGTTATPAVGQSLLAGSPAAVRWKEIKVRFLNPMSLEDSHVALGDTYIGKGDWARDSGGQQAEVELLINMMEGDSYAVEFETATRRAWEVWLHDTTNIADSGTAYADWRVVFPSMIPVGTPRVEGGMGQKFVRLTYRAQYEAVATCGWRVESTVKSLSAGYGATA